MERKRKKEKRVVPEEVRILLEEKKKTRAKKYGGYILRVGQIGEEGPGKPRAAEATEAEMVKTLWDVLSRKKCAPVMRKIKKVGRDKLYIEPENKETRKLLQNTSLDIRPAGERNPRIKVYGVGIEVKDEGVAALLEEQNEGSVNLGPGWNLSLELIPRKSRVNTRRGRDVEFAVTPEVAGEIVGKSLSVGLSRCRVGPSVDVRRCHRCQRYGHVGALCKAPSVVCGRCAGRHHAAHCVASQSVRRCTCCASSGWACDHVSGDTAKCRTWEVNFRREVRKFKWTV